jgi:predicted lipoprotein with Yx(FWY)xxD motif
MTTASRSWSTRGLGFAGAAAAVALLASACGSSSGGGSGGAANAAAGPVVVEAHSGPMGTFLTDGGGKSLYLFASDTATKSNCSGVCVSYWPPLTTTGKVKASGAAAASKLTTISRSDGTKQVVYAGHPLYYYKQDSAPGDTKGQGSTNFGARWWLVAPSGSAITSSGGSHPSSSSSSSSSSGGGSWG